MRIRLCHVVVCMFLFASSVLVAAEAAPEQAPKEQRDKLIAKARERAKQDQKKYTKEQLQECENLYQVANKNWRTPEAVATLKVMVEKYPDVNRTGCAVLYLAQMSTGKDRETRLQQAIDKFSDCMYFNGVQVGALSRFYLAADRWKAGDKEAAQKLFDQIKADYPDAITHGGVPLSVWVAQVQAAVAPTQTNATTAPAADLK